MILKRAKYKLRAIGEEAFPQMLKSPHVPSFPSNELGGYVEKSEQNRPPWEPRNVTNFPIDNLGWYVMAIEECGHSGVYIEKDAYTSTGCKLPDDYALMRVGDYDMTEFWHLFDELRVKYPVCPEVSIQDVMFGQSAECQKLIDEMRRKMRINLSVAG